MLALILCFANAADVKLTKKVLSIDGEKVFDVEARKDIGYAAYSFTKDGQFVFMLSRARETLKVNRLTVNLADGTIMEGRFEADEVDLINAFLRDGVLVNSTIDRAAFEKYAAKRSLPLGNTRDWGRITELWVESRCPTGVALIVDSKRLAGDKQLAHSIAGQGTQKLMLHLDDRICIAGTQTCIQVQPGLKTVGISLDCSRFE